MESNWRWNVWDIGWSDSSFELVGELRTPIPITFPPGVFAFYVGVRPRIFGLPYAQFVRGSDIGAPFSGWVPLFTNTPVQPFPGPFDVLPDRT